eukprot:351881_1
MSEKLILAAAELSNAARTLSPIGLDDFEHSYSRDKDFVKSLSYDPLDAKFSPSFLGESEEPAPGQKRYYRRNWILNEKEQGKLANHGFVVSERLGLGNFTDLYASIYSDDLPVFVSADSILHAWHRS